MKKKLKAKTVLRIMVDNESVPTYNIDPTQPQPMAITVAELIKESSKIKEFWGNSQYSLTSFIREVEIFLPHFVGTAVEQYILQRNVINKIQGPALQAIRTLGPNVTWDNIKAELIRNFGVRDTYYSLHHQALSLRNNNVSDYFYNLKEILDKLNTKYEFDYEKPVEFSPSANEAMIVKIFINGLDPNLASVVISRQTNNLRDAYYILEETGLIQINKNKYNRQNTNNKNYNNNNFNRQTSNQNDQTRHRHDNNHYNHRNYNNNSGQFRNNNNNNYNNYNNSGQYRNQNRNYSGQYKNPFNQNRNNSGQFKNNSNNNNNNNNGNNYNNNGYNNNNNNQRQNNNNQTPMECDHVQQAKEEVNFHSPPPDRIYR